MEFSDDIVFAILNFLRDKKAYDLLSFYYSEIPGGYSNHQIDFHLGHCKDYGFVEGQLSADKIMALAFLTPAGLRYLQSIENEADYEATNQENIVDKDHEELQVFISHSGEDFKLAKLLANLIQKSLRLSHKAIRCSSVDGYRLPGGITTDEQLRIEIHDARLFVGLITPNSLKSLYVAFELGARWGSEKPLIPLLAAGVTPSHLEGPLSGINALLCDNIGQVNQLIEETSSHLDITPEATSSYAEEINQLANLSSDIARETDNQHLKPNLEEDGDSASANANSVRASWDAISISPSQQTIDPDPRIAAIKLCARLTTAINYLIESDHENFGPRPQTSVNWRIEKLREAHVIDHMLASISFDLIGSRNAIAHGEDVAIHPENLQQFIAATERMESIVSSKRAFENSPKLPS